MQVYAPGYTRKCTTQQRIKGYHNCIFSTLILFVVITACLCTREPHSTLWKKFAGSFLQGANKNRLSPCFVATEHGYDRFIIFYVGRIWCFHKKWMSLCSLDHRRTKSWPKRRLNYGRSWRRFPRFPVFILQLPRDLSQTLRAVR